MCFKFSDDDSAQIHCFLSGFAKSAIELVVEAKLCKSWECASDHIPMYLCVSFICSISFCDSERNTSINKLLFLSLSLLSLCYIKANTFLSAEILQLFSLRLVKRAKSPVPLDDGQRQKKNLEMQYNLWVWIVRKWFTFFTFSFHFHN